MFNLSNDFQLTSILEIPNLNTILCSFKSSDLIIGINNDIIISNYDEFKIKNVL
jgi:hypothetical protein